MERDTSSETSNSTMEQGTPMENETLGAKVMGKKEIKVSRIKRRIFKHYRLVRIGLVLLVVGVFFLLILVFNLVFKNLPGGQYFTLAKNFLFPTSSAISASGGRTNILVLGKGGMGHTAPDLTDTIIVFSIPHGSGKIVSTSLPRDLWIPEIRAKVNTAYYWGNQKQEKGGIILAKSTVEQIVGIPIHYGAIVDFSSFKEVIDIIGGIDVDVENSFVDEKFPIPGKEEDLCGGDLEYKCRYETLSFNKGLEHMDGETALKFVRSRNAVGDEGTDIARETRQQKVIAALKTKLTSPKVVLSPKTVFGIINIARLSVETDLEPTQIAFIARKFVDLKDSTNLAIPEDLIFHPPTSARYDNQYVFIPRKEGWDEIHAWFQGLLNEN